MEGDWAEMTSGFVVDASVVCSWILPDEGTPKTDALLDQIQATEATAPDLLWHEVRNVLMMTRR
jgi:predicted nucleic acid-binding protein